MAVAAEAAPGTTAQPLTAAILATPDTVAAGMVAAWLRAGHHVQGIYVSKLGSNSSRLERDEQLASYCANISLQAQAKLAQTDLMHIDGATSWTVFVERCKANPPDVVLSLFFMARIPPHVLAALDCPVLNIHPALLPAYRGSSPVLSMLMDGTVAECAGVTMHVVESEFDTGAIIGQSPLAYRGHKLYGAFLHDMIEAGAALLLHRVPPLVRGEIAAVAQGAPPVGRSCHPLSDFQLSSFLTAGEIDKRVSAVGHFQRFRVQGLDPSITVDKFMRTLGPATGLPPQVGWFCVDMDATDARVRLRKSAYFRRYWRRLRETRQLAALQSRGA